MKAVDLIPSDLKRAGGRGGGRSGGLVYVLLGALAALLAAVVAFVLVGNQVTDRQGELARLKAETAVAEAEAEARALGPYARFATLERTRVSTVGGIAAGRVDWELAMRRLARVIPREVWLTSLTATANPSVQMENAGGGSETNALRTTGQSPAVELVGCTSDQAEVSRLMARLRVIDGVSRVALGASEKAETSGAGASEAGGGGGAGGTECRGGSDRVPRFQLVVFLDPPASAPATGATPAGTPAAGAPATTGVAAP